MKKLKLDDLRVESFATAPNVSTRGTVAGNEDTEGCATIDYGSCMAFCGTQPGVCGPGPGPTHDGMTCNYTCGGEECLSGGFTCDPAATNCQGDTNGYGMC